MAQPTLAYSCRSRYRPIVSARLPRTTIFALLLCCLVAPVRAAIKAGPATPGFELQPLSRAAMQGGPVSFSVIATGATSYAYQWWKGSTQLTNDLRFQGATNAVLKIEPLQLTDAGDFFVVVNSAGAAATSSVASLTVPRLVPVVAATGSTGAVVSITGLVGDVYRVEVSTDFGSNWRTNGYATNVTGTARSRFVNTTGDFALFRVAYQRLLPVLVPERRIGGAVQVRAYGRVEEVWQVQFTSDFVQWTPFATLTNFLGTTYVNDADPGALPRFYRLAPP